MSLALFAQSPQNSTPGVDAHGVFGRYLHSLSCFNGALGCGKGCRTEPVAFEQLLVARTLSGTVSDFPCGQLLVAVVLCPSLQNHEPKPACSLYPHFDSSRQPVERVLRTQVEVVCGK